VTPRDDRLDVLEVGDVQLLQGVGRDGAHRLRHFLQAFGLTTRRDDDFAELVSVCSRCRLRVRGSRCCRERDRQQARASQCPTDAAIHRFFPQFLLVQMPAAGFGDPRPYCSDLERRPAETCGGAKFCFGPLGQVPPDPA
jgi:hypothetical protein